MPLERRCCDLSNSKSQTKVKKEKKKRARLQKYMIKHVNTKLTKKKKEKKSIWAPTLRFNS